MAEAEFTLKGDLPSNLRNQRTRLYDWLRRCLMGPDSNAELESDDFDLRGIKPLDRYHVGILFPIVKGLSGTDPGNRGRKIGKAGHDKTPVRSAVFSGFFFFYPRR